jgi:biotin carboxyl carrier protein
MSVHSKKFKQGDASITVQVQRLEGDRWRAVVGGRSMEVEAHALPGGGIRIALDGAAVTAHAAADAAGVQVRVGGQTWLLPLDRGGRSADAHGGDGAIVAPMTGTVLKVLVAAGDDARRGEPLVVLNAMKMEHKLAAPFAGRVTALRCREGDIVEQGTILAVVEAAEPGPVKG